VAVSLRPRVECPDLLRRFTGVSDGRSDQGRDHPVAVVLTLCAAAVLAGMRSFTAIAGWVADVPTDLLARLYRTPTPGCPSKTTLWRVLTGVDASASCPRQPGAGPLGPGTGHRGGQGFPVIGGARPDCRGGIRPRDDVLTASPGS
jgi:hypothetical protein